MVIAPQWVLTAAHVVADATENSNVRFETDPDPEDNDELPLSGLFGILEIHIHENYDNGMGPAGGFDIALMKLDAEISHYSPYNLFRGGQEVGRQGTPVGFGATGDGNTGYDPQTGAFFRLAGDNMMDSLGSDPRLVPEFFDRPELGLTAEQIAAQYLISDFDDPATQSDDPNTSGINEAHTNDGLNPLGDAGPLDLEASVAPGDSGGPMFFLVNGEWQIAGINNFIHGFDPPIGDGTDTANYSDLAGYLRISQFQGWIDGITGIPEPGSVAMMFVGAFATLARRRRHRRRAG
ncbi:MAG: trypsin-like serine protease [Planctomycetota bacterium]|nr:trypsin-like serine protease [Planctomycetota bacterium]MDQ3441840.1 trypsin-like serine protease [Planctomycetota bacterium]